jgi:hypothetical protein
MPVSLSVSTNHGRFCFHSFKNCLERLDLCASYKHPHHMSSSKSPRNLTSTLNFWSHSNTLWLQKFIVEVKFRGDLVWIIRQGLKLRKYFRGQVGPHQLNFGSPHNLFGAHQVRIARLPPRLQGALWRGQYKLWPKWFVDETYYGRTGVRTKRLESVQIEWLFDPTILWVLTFPL